MNKRYILASSSPRRQELLKTIIPDFLVVPSNANEDVDPQLSPEEVALTLAERKAAEVFSRYPNDIVIGSDTIVVFEKRILGKPKDRREAAVTLEELSGKTHKVITGVCVMCGEKVLKNFDVTEVTMNYLTEEFIESYIESGSPMDKAGCYGIQDSGIVKGYYGSYTNVVGLPVATLKKMLNEVIR